MMILKPSQEYASLVPELSAEEYESLKQSIKENGLWVPIIVNSQGVILDGHHRYKACQELGIKEPSTVIKEFKDKLDEKLYVIDCNLKRRHLNNFQRTRLALESKSILEEIAARNQKAGVNNNNNKKKIDDTTSVRNLTQVGRGGRVDEQIGKMANVSRDTVRKVESIVQAVKEKPHLDFLVKEIDSGEMSVHEADQIIKNSQDESKKLGKRFKLREEVMKSDSYRCRDCSSILHLDVYTIHSFHDRDELENLETLCKDCHKFKMRFHKDVGLLTSLIWIFQGLTGMSGQKYFQYNVIGGNMISDSIRKNKNNKKEEDSIAAAAASASDYHYEDYTKKMEASPYARLKSASFAELVSRTKDHRKQLIQNIPKNAHEIYHLEKALHDLIPVLNDYSEMISNEAAVRRRKDKLSKP